jgi:hypothetical protein
MIENFKEALNEEDEDGKSIITGTSLEHFTAEIMQFQVSAKLFEILMISGVHAIVTYL